MGISIFFFLIFLSSSGNTYVNEDQYGQGLGQAVNVKAQPDQVKYSELLTLDLLFTRRQIFRLVQTQSICRRQNNNKLNNMCSFLDG